MGDEKKENSFEVVIVGAGPAGLSASVYASRYGIKNIVFGEVPGGLTTKTHEIGNWLGTEKITGFAFAQNAAAHVKSYGAEIVSAKIDQIEKAENDFILFASDGRKVRARAVLLAMGTKHRKLGIPGEHELLGKGVSYCATCDGFFFKNKTVAVIGGNDSAAEAAVFLAGLAEKVFIIYRREELRAERFWTEAVAKNAKIEIIYNTNVKAISGEQKVEALILDNPYQGAEVLKIDGIFVEIGLDPNTELVENLEIETDAEGHIKVGPDGRTTGKGLWAAGDITDGSNKFKQIITAASEGAIAIASIQKFLKK